MTVDEVIDVVVVGHVDDPDDTEGLIRVDGVMAVEPTHRFQLPPPDAEVQ
jgi:hypothetical protein